jgi:hypothetical protein
LKLREEDIWWKVTDQRIGMGIGGWHMRYELIHTPTKCSICYETHGSSPNNWKQRDKAKQLLELLIEDYIEEVKL